jgi:WD40 repeat protein
MTASDDGTVRVWYSRPRELQAEFASSYANGSANPVVGAAYISRGRIIVLDYSGDMYAFTPGGKRLATISSGTSVYTAAWDTAGTKIVTTYYDGTVDVRHASDSDYTQMHRSASIRVNGLPQDVAMSPDGSSFTIVTSGNPYEVQLRNGQTGQLMRTRDAANSISVVAFSPNGRQIFAGDNNGQVEVWDAVTGHRRVLDTPGPAVNDVEFNNSGSEFVTASQGGTVSVWSALGDQPLISFDACPSPTVASPSPDGSKIVVARGDGSAPVFDAATGQQLTALPATSTGSVSSVGFSPDGKSIITVVDSEGTGGVQIWNAELANPSPSVIAQIAQQRITRQLTPAERATYLAGIG